MFDKIKSILKPKSERSAQAIRNIALSFGAKGFTIVIGLVLVPMTINYVNPTQYGIWLTLSQIISWITVFDLGLGNGFRNRYAQAKANGDMVLARQYLSTSYFTIICIVCVALVIIAAAYRIISWSSLLKVDSSYDNELGKVFLIVGIFFCINMVASLFSTLLTADQKPGMSSLVYGAGQFFSLVALFILTRNTEGSLYNLALYYSGVPCLVMIVISIYAYFRTDYSTVRPSFRYIRPQLVKDILGLGLKFFVICLSMIAIFQVINIVIAREIGADAVTEYNIAFRYFNVLYSVALIVITPFWSAFTDAFVKKDYSWMGRTLKTLERCWILCLAAGIIMLVFSNCFYRIWIGESVSVEFTTSVGMMIFMSAQILGNIYMYIINGIGTIRIQLVIYLVFAVISWPCMTYFCRCYGLWGVLLVPAAVYTAQALMCRAQIHKLISGTGGGWWVK